MVRVAAVAIIAVVVLLGCTPASTDTSDTTATGPQSVSTVTTRAPATSIATTTTVAEPTTTTSTTAVASTTTTTAPTTTSRMPVSDLVLRGDGLGIVAFGDPVEDVMAILIDLFGPPSYDRLEESPFAPEGWTGPDRGPSACHFATVPIFGGHACFDYIRVASWSDVSLRVVFSDLVNLGAEAIWGDAEYVEVPPGLRGYGYGAGETVPSARTVQGITVGSTVGELLTLGEAVTFGLGCGDDVEFSIDDPNSANGGVIHGSLLGTDGEAFIESENVNPDATVRWFSAGQGRSC